ncbi:ammonium transporter [Corynebacterium terpenotabidum]|uniref:Ammonium transporter n=1 Tax=Corynebacterium terpenotabidum Y-11 TaxID=1200352 RepID=S4XBG5_9CORY|nr:ammonium transporter [Corynebacterium terpenotabidum]AGP30442.1 ammonium transporter [Corynebacterium terpenotabidum Y-11]
MDPADIAWILAAVALVLLMFPGLAMLYGGMLSGRSVINMMMMVMSSLAVTTVVYVVVGHGMVVGESVGGWGLIGDPTSYSFFSSLVSDDENGSTLFGAFYILFAAISVALVASGAAGRMKFDAWMIFAAIWVLLVYAPLGHWVFSPEGWMRGDLGLHDYAGGTAVHMNAGAAGLALALVLGRRAKTDEKPHNLPLMLVGVGMIAMGWLGFNGGTAAGANFLAEYVVLTTILAFAGGMLGYIIMQRIVDGAYTLMGLATGGLGGMVAITPVADAVNPVCAIAVGALGAAGAYGMIKLKDRLGIDDAADVFAVHGVAGMVGALFVVFFADPSTPAERTGILFGGDWDLLWREIVAIVVTIAYSFCVTYAIGWVMNKIYPIKFDDETQLQGVDAVVHDEQAYDNVIAPGEEKLEEPARA